LNRHRPAQKATPALALSVILLASLAACGGGTSPATSADAAPAAVAGDTAQSTDISSADTVASADAVAPLDSATAAAVAATEVQPMYHMAPVLLDEPARDDIGGTNASARRAPTHVQVDASAAELDTHLLTRDVLAKRIADTSRMRVASASGSAAAPLAQAIISAVHTPAQIRAAYGLPELPAVGASLTAAQQAALGAGQTIYIVDAYHDATALSDLNAFSSRFGLPTCSNVAIPATAALPLAKPPASCTFSAVNSTTAGGMTTTVPAYNGTWAPESKLDVQWAHAIAPLARIVLIEMPNSMSNSILGANALATRMGPGVVSMSFGSAEAGWAPTTEGNFAGAGMTYVAAAGDSGTQVLWPAVSSHVIAVGGTSLNWSGTGTRYEATWLHSGGGLSAYVTLPAWQNGVTPAGGSNLVRRAVPDVAFNANPSTGQYVALTLPGASATVWSAYGGTSIAAPQWAGVVAVANAMRAANAKPTLGDFHALLYQNIAAVPGTYSASLGDVVDGTNGTCATCRAGTGFDQATGWGTPNSAKLLEALSGSTTTQTTTTSASPTLVAGSYTGRVGAAFAQALHATVPPGTTAKYSLVGAPSGMAITSSGALSWAAPVAGNYSFTARSTTSTGKTASATVTLKVIPAVQPKFVSAGKFAAKTSDAFRAALSATNPNTGTLAYTLTGAPSGLVVSNTGALGWTAPVAGTWTFTAQVRDSYGYSSSQVQTITVAASTTTAANHAPTLAAASYTGKAGTTFSTSLSGKDADGGTLTYTIAGAPTGMNLTSSGFLYWVTPVKGSYSFKVTVHDSKGAIATATMKLTVA